MSKKFDAEKVAKQTWARCHLFDSYEELEGGDFSLSGSDYLSPIQEALLSAYTQGQESMRERAADRVYPQGDDGEPVDDMGRMRDALAAGIRALPLEGGEQDG